MKRDSPGFFDVDERLAELSAKGDDLERLNALVDFELFRAASETAVPLSDHSKGGLPPFAHVLMFKVLILQATHSLSGERCEYLIKERLSLMRFLGLGLADTAYRSAKNEATLSRRGFVSRIHRKKPKGKPMPERMRIANALMSKVRSAVEYVFPHKKGPTGYLVRTIGIVRAKVEIDLANLAYKMRRFVWLTTQYATA
ncbi:transposase [Methylocystis sp. B8]|uniref:transposase n=1 Tax=Methylocystis sp. B8 TaxID=544938 RepID=UPI0010FDC301|nr:transposase [Methylocystis sp. B8]TLG77590.1 transposase [Methylocystis sp. B8]